MTAAPVARDIQFIQATRAWWFQPADAAQRLLFQQEGLTEEITVQQRTDGNLDFEFGIVWHRVTGGAQVRVASDAFDAFTALRPLFDALAERGNVGEGEVRDLLVDLFDAVDATPTVNPVQVERASQTSDDWETEGRIRYSEFRRRYDIRKDWADLSDEERREWRDDARREAGQPSGRG